MDIMITKPIPRKAIWGNTKLKRYFRYCTYPDGIGQSWSFSGQENNANEIVGGMHKGLNLQEVWNRYPEYFHSRYTYFPFIIGLVGPEDNLSIQVHPDKGYAQKKGLLSGKNEAWYFIEAEVGADLVFGNCAQDRAQLKEMVDKKQWNQLIRRIPVKQDDFVYVPAGMLHAMQKGVITYEVQEATDITYRFYDYDRVNKEGIKRELHLTDAMESIRYFAEDEIQQELPVVETGNIYECTTYINNESFKIQKYIFHDDGELVVDEYMLVTIIRGEGEVNMHSLRYGESFIIPKGIQTIKISGKMEWMVTMEGKR
ncbi:mannose-6-phosphate isomerase [Breznakia sp. PF5-3]|uniref:type I phosphomannose isomerase catalytic subunit n=1 Tax=unclassified Breznakia TaxID=2623764 RepID=UPI002404E79B|nr:MULTISPECIES: type I phosphomannose isomerase catalytic subunit [unclassified Breznakia]MDF9823861.1 mannose-6-phosphate isomerase [Breznakia sp. PM6-1]MDF9834573.1 mannose-6-phosphate isomerase [Breznakia sp. PF5-3]MDF9836810.1 mannose-6-phosphate isomerase [Breznakia sp. PFB2-8]MDF9858741.1 mannose-6-phosphate isomerase [Breznakia sp. PH5-24]